MARRLSLPVADKLLESLGPPTLAAMRTKLGGRSEAPAAGSIAPGTFVAVGEPSSLAIAARVGVVLAVGPVDADVYLTRGMVKRTLAALLVVHEGAVPSELAEIRPAIESFAKLEDGQRVWFERDGVIAEGTLLERCRYGALVGDADGKVLGVGFRKVFDKPPPAPGAN